MKKIGIIGAGNMGEAIIAGSLKKFSILVSEQCLKRQKYLLKNFRLKSCDIKSLAKACRVIVIAVKPQDIDSIVDNLKSVITKNTLVISIAAGITTQYLEKKLGKKVRVVRAMPNLPSKIQQGITAVCKGKSATSADVKVASQVFKNIGEVVAVKEKQINVVTAISGSGPGYVFLFMEYMIQSAQRLGLDHALAKKLVCQTFLGSVNLLSKVKEHPKVLRSKVASKGGTTQAAIDVFRNKKAEAIFHQALKAACLRAKVLSRRT